jgi:FtsP/CotA-like multicopper oxidase with cupredoxin domain
MTSLNRRDILKLIALTGAAGGAMSCNYVFRQAVPPVDSSGPATAPEPTIAPAEPQPAAAPLEIRLTAAPGQVQLLPGNPTVVWSYSGEVLGGNPQSLQTLPGSYLGPILRVQTGQTLKVHFVNELPEDSIIHWHGLHIPAGMDGHPKNVIGPGAEFTYEFSIQNRAGTYWFHPHPDGRTGPQAYAGLAGLLLVSDLQEQALGLPSGEFDLPLVIQDRTFDTQNQLVYNRGGMMGMDGFLGERVLVNGQMNYSLDAQARPYRLRLLNGSNSRIYRIGWDDGAPLTVIATDGGLLAKPVRRPFVMLAPGERVELWTDFSQWRTEQEHRLVSLPFSGADQMGGMMGGGMMAGSSGPALGTRMEILTVRTIPAQSSGLALPERLGDLAPTAPSAAVNAARPRRFSLSMAQMMTWSINGRTFEMDGITEQETVRLNTAEVWEIENTPGGMGGMMGGGMSMAHPMHIHGLQFRVIERQGPRFDSNYNVIRPGFVDEGWKDTVLVWPGERVRLLLRFEDYIGTYLYHCHNLEHEDLGMMRNYRVVDS